MPMPANMMENEMIGAIKIKDGLFIGDEYASTVSVTHPFLSLSFFHLSHAILFHHLYLSWCIDWHDLNAAAVI